MDIESTSKEDNMLVIPAIYTVKKNSGPKTNPIVPRILNTWGYATKIKVVPCETISETGVPDWRDI